jgi:hypothetical protein
VLDAKGGPFDLTDPGDVGLDRSLGRDALDDAQQKTEHTRHGPGARQDCQDLVVGVGGICRVARERDRAGGLDIIGAERAGEPNQRGVQGQVAVVGAAGVVVARVASDPSGRFAVDLPPGRYTLRLTSLRWPAGSSPQAVTVASGRVTWAVLVLDSGIR